CGGGASGAGQAARIGRSGHVGDDIADRERLAARGRERDGLVTLDEDAAAIGGAIGPCRALAGAAGIGATGTLGNGAPAQTAAFDGQAAALLDENIAAGAESAAATAIAGGRHPGVPGFTAAKAAGTTSGALE